MTKEEYLEKRDAIFEEYQEAKAAALAVRSALFVHEITTPLWAPFHERLLALESDMMAPHPPERLEARLLATQQALAALQVDISMQRAEAVLDDQRRELLEEEP